MKIPKFLIEMSEQMNNEDNRCTADPIWMVYHDNWLTCADDRGDKEILLLQDGDHHMECDDGDHIEISKYLIEHYNDWCLDYIKSSCEEADGVDIIDELESYLNLEGYYLYSLPADVTIEKLCMQKEMKVINSHLTLEGANQFIARKQHDYPKLYTYVYSMYYCNQMKELRQWIKSLSSNEE